MLCQDRWIDIADGCELYIVGIGLEGSEVVLRYPSATDKADANLATLYLSEVNHGRPLVTIKA
jgi:hypothetical protein